MIKSESTMELAKALALAQFSLEGAKHDASNPFYKSKYSTLASVWEACRKPLTDNGLSVVQTTAYEEGNSFLETTLLHTSGEWITGRLLLITQNTPQSQGSAITYARRYSLAAMVGICPEDDDAEGAMVRGKPKEQVKAKPKVESLATKAKDIMGAKETHVDEGWSAFWAKTGSELGLDSAAVHNLLGVKSVKADLVEKGKTLQEVYKMLCEKVAHEQP